MVSDSRTDSNTTRPSSHARQADDASCEHGLQILRSLRRIIHAMDMHSRGLYQKYRITTPQLFCLHCLAQQGEMTLSQLAREVSLGASTTNGIVDRLESNALLTRVRSRDDRRKVSLAITDAGRTLIAEAPGLLPDGFIHALWDLPDRQQAAIAKSLERVVSLMGTEMA